ncbi:hypothetical protein BMS3Abin06_01631 [bacterium BMS3Abin06]|nr:hypothetical protein BMS3Abin06_01631 [bacterium BMS3Abin06]HDZ00823.1 HEPN domain-containing protein [Nitrospirota bacterium]
MDKKQSIDYWLNSAAHDLDVAETLLRNEKYDWCLFIEPTHKLKINSSN